MAEIKSESVAAFIPESGAGLFRNQHKGKLIGQKPPLRQNMFGRIRTRLQMDGRTRDLAMFNLAIDSKLPGCDVVALRVDDVAPSGYAVDRARVRQKKTGRPVKFKLTEQTRQAVDDYIKATGKRPGEFLFRGRGHNRCTTTRQYARLVSSWIATIGLDPRFFGTHSLRRTKATLIYRRTGNLRTVQLLSGTYQGSRAPSDISALRSTMPCRTGRRLNYRGKAALALPPSIVGGVPMADVTGANTEFGTSRAVHCCTRRDQPKAARNCPLQVGALGASDGPEALEGLALVLKAEE